MTLNGICRLINSRIITMNYAQEKAVREYFEDTYENIEDIAPDEWDSDTIADILNVNESCIYDLLVLKQ